MHADAEAVLDGTKKAGIETRAFQRNIDQALALAGRGDFVAAERFLRRISIRTLDQRRERVLQGIVEKAQARVRYAEERGGNVEEAEVHLAEARNALALREYHRIRPLASKAIEKADAQRKYARAETILDRAAADVEAARRETVRQGRGAREGRGGGGAGGAPRAAGRDRVRQSRGGGGGLAHPGARPRPLQTLPRRSHEGGGGAAPRGRGAARPPGPPL